MKVSKVAILGAGNGGMTAAADLKDRGLDVALYELPQFAKNLDVIKEKGGILFQTLHVEPESEKFIPIEVVTSDIETAVKDAQVIMLTIPGFAVDAFVEVLEPVVTEDQVIFFNGAASMGCVKFANKAKELGVTKKFKLCEVNSLAYGTRGIADEARVELSLRVKKLFFAAYPAEDTEELLDVCKQIYDCLVPAKNIWHTTLENGNPEVHPAPCLLNAGRVDYSNGEFWLYKEGMTEHTVNVLRAIERERMAVGKSFGLDLEDAVQSRYRRGYFDNDQKDLQTLFNTSKIYPKIKGPTSCNSRYYVEDISDGLVLWSDLGKVAGVETPNIDAVITLGGSLLKTDFRQSGLTLKSLKLDGLSLDELINAV